MELIRNEFRLSTNPAELDLDVIHGFLRTAYWSENISRALLAKAIQNSLCFGVYEERRQIGFARVISDYASFAYLADVFILEAFRGRGLAAWLVENILRHPDLQGLRRWSLATRNAHELYAKFGFTPLKHPEIFMEIHRPDIYKEQLNR
ncbi:MAG: GNAT family N-acetyltransferase [Gammaproteobacteria bacterium]|nr:GNAT family N-acetyltransferase [Gammaproteobacteria bacterium]